jgi:hypothetical protein
MALAYLLASLLAAVPGAALRLPAFVACGFARYRVATAIAAAVVLCVTFLGYVAAYDEAVWELRAGSPAARLPIALFGMLPYRSASTSRGDELLLFIVLGTVALALFVANLDALGIRARRTLTLGVCAAMAYGALAAHAADSSDIYLYVGLAALGPAAYAPPAVPFPADLAAVNQLWGTPLFPSAYGPVWIAVSHVALAAFASLAAKLFVLRVIGLGSVLGCALLARALGAPSRVVAAVACNPALYDLYVVNAHNDLFGVDLVLAAMLATRRNLGLLGMLLAIAGALCKVTLLPVAFLAAPGEASLPQRLRFAGVVTAAVVLVYAFGEGGMLRHALVAASEVHANPKNPIDLAFHALPALIALAAALYALFTGRIRAQAAWTLPALGQFALTWYFAWGFPFALAATDVAVPFFVTLPVVILMLSPLFPVTPAFIALRVLVVAGGFGLVYYNLRGPRPSPG